MHAYEKKICPVCDRELTAAGYCRLCRRLVFKPVVRDVDYYLNENRPDNQTLLNQKRIGEENQLEGEEGKQICGKRWPGTARRP